MNNPLETLAGWCASYRQAKRSQGSSPRNEYEQLEYQRKNAHLFTTPTQSVGPDGKIITFDDVTAKLQHTLKRLQEMHQKQFKGKHPTFCMRPVIGAPENPLCQMIELCESDMDKVSTGFVQEYMQMQEHMRRTHK